MMADPGTITHVLEVAERVKAANDQHLAEIAAAAERAAATIPQPPATAEG